MNGVLIGTSTNMSRPDNVIRKKCFFGSSNENNKSLLNADLDEIRFYNRSLTTSEIVDDFNQRNNILIKLNT